MCACQLLTCVHSPSMDPSLRCRFARASDSVHHHPNVATAFSLIHPLSGLWQSFSTWEANVCIAAPTTVHDSCQRGRLQLQDDRDPQHVSKRTMWSDSVARIVHQRRDYPSVTVVLTTGVGCDSIAVSTRQSRDSVEVCHEHCRKHSLCSRDE